MTRASAAPLIVLSHRIAHEGACDQVRDIGRLRTTAEHLINTHQVPEALAESMLSGVNALVAETPLCLPPVPASAPAPAPAPPRPEHGPHHDKHKDGHHH